MRISRSNKPKILITMGDPSGIGPEVTLKALAGLRYSKLASFFVIGDSFVLERAARSLKLKLNAGLIDLANVRPQDFSYGCSDGRFGKASMEYVDKALELLKKGEAHALVTAPVNKFSVRSAGFTRFTGHTEYLAAHTAAKDYAMMFAAEKLKVALVTRHIALKDVPRSLSVDKIYRTTMLTHDALKHLFRIKRPRIGVAGLNPHAGEKGLLGDEEKRLIIPAIRKLSGKIKGVAGPIPPDVLFYEMFGGKKFDAAVTMYHDQGLIPFKMLYFTSGVNLTLGLPFVRTSPDHGTAFEIAGKMQADPESMKEAILLACRLSSNQARSGK